MDKTTINIMLRCNVNYHFCIEFFRISTCPIILIFFKLPVIAAVASPDYCWS